MARNAVTIDLSALQRDPDFSAPDLRAYDATDVLLTEMVPAVHGRVPGNRVVVIGDRHGAITLQLTLPTEHGGYDLRGVRVHQDPLLHERALDRNAQRLGGVAAASDERYTHHQLGSALLSDAQLVLLQLPKSLEELREIASLIARHASPEVTVLAGGRVKHMTRTQNTVLGEYFTRVQAGLAHKKSRVLTATGPVTDPGSHPFPVLGTDPDLPGALLAYGATFGGATLDHGSRLLLRQLSQLQTSPRRIVDLGCGNGSLTLAAAHAFPEAELLASDQSSAAVAATQGTVDVAGLTDRVRVVRADGCAAVPHGWADLVLLNPPFHTGQVVNEAIAHRLIAQTPAALAPGGALLVVYNSHLRHRRIAEHHFERVTQLARDATFTVLVAN